MGVRIDFELFSGIDQRHDVGAAERHHHARRTAALIDAGAAENLLKSGHVWFFCPALIRQREIFARGNESLLLRRREHDPAGPRGEMQKISAAKFHGGMPRTCSIDSTD